MLCVVASKVTGSEVAPVWVQECIVMHPDPAPKDPADGPYAEIFVTVLLRRNPGLPNPQPGKGQCDFAFVHRGLITKPEDVGESIRSGPLKWVNAITPEGRFGPVRRGLALRDEGRVDVTIHPMDGQAVRFDLESPVRSAPIRTETKVSALPAQEERPVFTHVCARPQCKACSPHGCCLARLHFKTDEGVDRGDRCVRYPAYGPSYVSRELHQSIKAIKDEGRQKELWASYRRFMFEADPIIYDLALMGSEETYRYEVGAGHRYQFVPPFFVQWNGAQDPSAGRKKLVRYFTPDLSEGDFMIAGLAEKLGPESAAEAAVRREAARAARGMPVDEGTREQVTDLLEEIGNSLDGLRS